MYKKRHFERLFENLISQMNLLRNQKYGLFFSELMQGNRMEKSLIFVQSHLFFTYDLAKNIIIES